tara:strand:+ start:43408 stop:44439 length:1032 start_codon:yes stop_codon:yes gene_type:complete
MQKLTITQPDDWHIHLRDGSYLSRTVADASRQFERAIIMPNLTPPVTTVDDAEQYYQRILAQIPSDQTFAPLMSLYLTDNTTVESIIAASEHPHIHACKLYPAGATTNSDSGVTDIEKLYPIFTAMQKHGLVLCVHGEVTTADIDIFDREARFIETVLIPIVREFPELKIVMEHITTKDAVEFVQAAPLHVAATITAHHLLYNRNDLLVGGIKPHYYCLPVLKRNTHQQALLAAAASGNPKFFLGTDSAPHAVEQKQSACGCAGIYTAHAAIELYAMAFEQMNALDKLEGFASCYGADFYGLSRNTATIELVKENWQVPNLLPFGDTELSPLCAGETLPWRLV